MSCQKKSVIQDVDFQSIVGVWESESKIQEEKIIITFHKNGRFNMEKSGERNKTYKVTEVFTKESQNFLPTWDEYILDGEKLFSHIDGFSFFVNKQRDSLFLFMKQINHFYADSIYEIYLTKK